MGRRLHSVRRKPDLTGSWHGATAAGTGDAPLSVLRDVKQPRPSDKGMPGYTDAELRTIVVSLWRDREADSEFVRRDSRVDLPHAAMR